jgi:hypothetical protein
VVRGTFPEILADGFSPVWREKTEFKEIIRLLFCGNFQKYGSLRKLKKPIWRKIIGFLGYIGYRGAEAASSTASRITASSMGLGTSRITPLLLLIPAQQTDELHVPRMSRN